jgi:hypothetical protein
VPSRCEAKNPARSFVQLFSHVDLRCSVNLRFQPIDSNGIFLLRASRNPSANRSLIAFTAWSSLVHAAIMTVQALQNPSEHGHLLGDIPVLSLSALH